MACTLCGEADTRIIRTKLRNGVDRKVLECVACGLCFLEQESSDLRSYYAEEYRQKYTPVIGRQLTSREMFDLCLPFQARRIERIDQLLSSRTRVLDVGCSAGHFLYALHDRVGSCTGIEFNESDAEFVRDDLGFPVYETPVEETDLAEASFDLITVNQVLEHVEDPCSFLGALGRYLAPDGWICIEVPNLDDALMSVYDIEEFHDFWFREVHLFNYSARTLRMMLEKCGFAGDVQSVTFYNLLNHLHWSSTRKPQPSMDLGMGVPVLSIRDSPAAVELNRWVQKVDAEYKLLLDKHFLGDSLLFIGQKTLL